MTRRTLALACALVAALMLGCGGGSDSDDSENGGSNEPVTLTVWDWSAPDPKAMKQIDDAYMAEHPNVTIKRVHQPFNSYFTLVRSAIAARKGPDIFAVYATPFIQDFANGIQPLDDLRTDEDADALLGWDYMEKDGHPLGVPYTGNGTMWYYNKADFRKAGLDPEEPPKTWDDLLAACDKLKAAGITPIVAGWKDGYYAEWWISQFAPQYQSDEELAKAASDPDWDSPSLHKTFALMQDLYDRGCFTPNSEGVPLFPNAVDEFKAGKGAMFIGLSAGDIHWAQFRETPWGKKNLGAFLAPLVPDSLWDEQRINYAPAFASAITRWSPNKEAAYDYASYLASAKSQRLLFEQSGAFPNRRDVELEADDPVAAEILDWSASKEAYADQSGLIRANVQGVFDKMIPEIITGSKSYADYADQLVAEQEKAASN